MADLAAKAETAAGAKDHGYLVADTTAASASAAGPSDSRPNDIRFSLLAVNVARIGKPGQDRPHYYGEDLQPACDAAWIEEDRQESASIELPLPTATPPHRRAPR